MKLVLNDGWKLKRIFTNEIFDVKIPFSVLSVFNEKIDLYFRDNEDLALSYLNEDYEIYNEFYISEEVLKEEKIYLTLQVDTLARVFLNNIEIASLKNMHHPYEIEVKKFLKIGNNLIKIILYSPLNYIERFQNSFPLYGVKEAIAGYPYIRKAHYMFGWDWGAKLPDIGIYHIPEINPLIARIDRLNLSQKHFKKRVILEFNISITNNLNKDLTLSARIISPSKAEFYYEGNIKNNLSWEIEINNPFLWWPNGYGEQNLYELELLIKDGEKILDIKRKKIGLRKIELIREKDKIGESFYFKVNDKDIFIKGANFIPPDHIIPFITKERIKSLLKDCIEANFNAIRVWGGGYYPEDYFYELCDEFGILVWQDFMFACSQYPPDRNFIEEVKCEVEYNIEKLKLHPSIMLWCGNNEVEEAWVYWGIPQHKTLKKTYIKIFEKIIPSLVKKLDPDRPYWPSSPSAKGHFYSPRKEEVGDSHYWAVWHGLKPFEDYKFHNFRFVSEFGFQSFPSIKTINTFTIPEDRNIFSYVMEKHQKNSSANGKIIYYLSENYLFPKDFRSLIYLSQLLQAEAIKYGVKYFRIKSDICRGAIYWQLNDSWPVASWSSIDYYGRWKVLHYYAKKFFSSTILAEDMENDKIKIYLINDDYKEKELLFKFKISTFKGEILFKEEKEVKTLNFGSKEIFTYSFKKEEILNKREIYIDFAIYNKNEEIYRDFTFLVKPKHVIWEVPVLSINFISENQIKIHTQNFAKNIEIEFDNSDVILSDNYFDLPHNEEKIISIIKKNDNITFDELKRGLKIFNLHDSFL